MTRYLIPSLILIQLWACASKKNIATTEDLPKQAEESIEKKDDKEVPLLPYSEEAMNYANSIQADQLSEHLHILASDEYEGRETGRKGQKMAADYIKTQFARAGVAPGNNGDFFQRFQVIEKDPKNSEFRIGSKQLTYFQDYYFYPSVIPDTLMEVNMEELVFLGYGIGDSLWNDYAERNIVGKTVVINGGFPDKVKLDKEDWTLMKRYQEAVKNGANFVFLITNDYDKASLAVEHSVTGTTMHLAGEQKKVYRNYIPFIVLNEKTCGDVSKANRIILNTTNKGALLSTENVLGYIEGSKYPDEVVVITAHYDHIGIDKEKKEIYNGADDDGTGTVSLIEIAEAFSNAKKDGIGPLRSILIMAVSGEEKGLLGSQYYTDNPVYKLENTVVDLNIDMTGRIDKNHDGDSNYVYLIGSDKISKDLHQLSESVNATYSKMNLDYTYNDENDPNRFYYRSDHYNFAKNNIPVIFYFSGVHEDYHKPTDTVDKIIFAKVEKTAKLVFLTAWEIANRDARLEK